jgi:hypothetical protein
VVVGVAVLAALFLVVRQFVRPFGKAKGTCRSCGDVCVCEQTRRTQDKA